MVLQIQTVLLPILYSTSPRYSSMPDSPCFDYQWQTWQAQVQKGFVEWCSFINIYVYLWKGWM